MFSFFKNLNKNKQEKKFDEELSTLLKKLKEIYDYNSLPKEKKDDIRKIIEKNGYLPYSYIQALEELSEAEILYGLEVKWALNKI